MNKIVSIAIFCMFTFGANAQQLKSQVPATAKKMTTAEANALNGKAEPTINGMPYSQYKAQQDALKQKQTSENKTVTARATLPVVSKEQPAAAVVVADKKTAPADKQPYADKTIPGTLLTPPAINMGSANAPKAVTEIQAPVAPAPVKSGNK